VGAIHFSAIQSGSIALNPDNIADGGRGTVAATITGLAAGDILLLYPPATLNAGLGYAGHRVTANTVTVELYNGSGGAINDGETTWSYVWIDCT